jgi:hypothetical protein
MTGSVHRYNTDELLPALAASGITECVVDVA